MSIWVVLPVALLAAAMVASLVRKAGGAASSRALRDRLEVAPWAWPLIGFAEGSAAAGLVFGLFRPALGLASAAGVALLMLGAVLAHLRVGIAGRPLLPPAVLLGLAVAAAWGFASVA
jgi:hypothetical protein